MNKRNEYQKGLFRTFGQITAYACLGIVVFAILLVLGGAAEFAEWLTDGAIKVTTTN